MNKTKLLALILSAAMVAGALTGCGNDEKTPDAQSSQTSSSSEVSSEVSSETSSEESVPNSAPMEVADEISVDYTDAFSVEYLDEGIKKVTDGENRELILISKEIDEVPEEYKDSIVIRTPVERAIFLSATQVCSLRPLNNDEIFKSVAGVSNGAEQWGDFAQIKNGIEDGSIKYVGGDMGDPDYELISSLNPDIVFVYTGDWPQAGVIEKLTELGINYAVDNDYMEKDYLARMEWAKFILTFFNEDEAAMKIMDTAIENIENVKKTVEGLEQPKVLFASEFNGTVNVTDSNGWLGNMIKDAGGKSLFEGMPVESLSLSLEEFVVKANEADIIVYTSTPTWMPGKSALLEKIPQLADCEAVKNGNLWQYTENFWNGIDKSDVMAEDLAAIFYPEKYEGRELTFFTKMTD